MSSENNTSEASTTFVVYLVLAVIMAAFFAWSQGEVKVNGKIQQQFGFITQVFIFIAAIPGGVVGLYIGRFVRNAIAPDFITAGSYFDLLRTKLFWAIGPQAHCCPVKG